MKLKKHRMETRAIHAGEIRPRIQGAVVLPIFQSANYEFAGEEDYHSLHYIRLNNTPNHVALHAKLASLENAEAALVTASGMAAISTALLTMLAPGDHLLVQEDLYGGTFDLITKDFPNMGISFDFIHPDDPTSWQKYLKPRTRIIYVETMSNPLLRIPDLKAVTAFAREHHLISVIDNTFASPYNFRPIEHGFDLVLHSCTKYLNGHSDIVAGAIIGKSEMVQRIRHRLNHLGGSLDPHAAFLLHRGIRTLCVRMKYINESALRIAQFLENHPAIAKVNYPGLESHPQHARARELFAGYSGMMSFELKGGLAAAENLLKRVHLPVIAPSLGGVESLLTLPATTSHAGLTPEERKRVGISDSLVRMSVGLEAPEDLIADLDQAFSTQH